MSRIPSSIRRPLSEFLGLPTLIALGFLMLALDVYAFENSSVGWLQLLRTVMRQHVFGNPQSTSDILSTIASSTITVTSITFSLILLAIQQSASSMTFQRQASGDPDALRRPQGAIKLDRQRDLSTDPAFGIEQLVNIAWTSASTSKQSPMPGLLAIRGLRDILSRWATNGEQANGGDQPGEKSELRRPPIVYHDDVMDQLFDAFEYLAVVSSESLQAQAFAEVATALSRTLDRLSPREQQRVADIVDRIVTTLGEHVLTRNLDEALTELVEALERNDLLAAAQVLRTAHSELRSVLGQLAGRSSRVTKADG